jgi:REP element-mobilizing transposase RayT
MPANAVKAKRRSRVLRRESDEHLWFVTTRVAEARYWLHPILTSGLEPPNRAARRLCSHNERHLNKRLSRCVRQANARRGPYQPELTLEAAKRIARGTVGSALARAQQRYGTTIYGLVVMSNHLHVLVRTRGKNLALFMRDAKSAITGAINLLTGKRGTLWERRYDAQPVVDDVGAAERHGYMTDNPCKAGLVGDPAHWPGLNLAYGFGDEDELTFEYLDRTAWHGAGRPKDLSRFFRSATLTLSPLPSAEGCSRDTYRASLMSWVEVAHEKALAKECDANQAKSERTRRPRDVLGVDKVIAAPFDTWPKEPARTERPYVFGAPDNCRAYTAAAVALDQTHRELSARYRAGDHSVTFPPGMYSPPLLQAA